MKRTRLSICRAKCAYPSEADARAAALAAGLDLRPYPCDRCRAHHLTSRRKGKRVPRPVAASL
ncbi:hypothetical protein GGQ97_001144 [Sphingomonas kaistensis]|uniref:Uncharacterized protein n=1 Tax=Sphingomonas kaistensis TaxID=298708 RepID=A0A7X5Y8A6_9SPHN|nr:hypothetical protein [Sphingomonas kaistensis]